MDSTELGNISRGVRERKEARNGRNSGLRDYGNFLIHITVCTSHIWHGVMEMTNEQFFLLLLCVAPLPVLQ